MAIHVFGIRHHGPGSARSLVQALTTLQPDCLLVEGPPDAEILLPLLPKLRPPVALLLYVPDNPQRAVYYPFAVFSPEWQAIEFALNQQIPVRFMDLPHSHRFAMGELEVERSPEASSTSEPAKPPEIHTDPLRLLALVAGYSDSERWWEHLVEQRQESSELFAAILEAMTELRQTVEAAPLPLEAEREAYMRKTIREAQKQGFQNIAVVCGAWHAPALAELPPAKEDTALLKGLPKVKVEATWIPWTYGRLLMSSGYGAGVESPGWYQHLWDMGYEQSGTRSLRVAGTDSPSLDTQASTIHWMTRVAHLLRQQDLDASSASVIEAVRLAETLAALRDRPIPGLSELNEATQTVLCFGDPLPMQLIHDRLIVGERLGKVPSETPMVPLQQDLLRQQKRLRLKPEASETTLELDLRKPIDLERSQLLRQLLLLDLTWGKLQSSGKTKGTFRETWQLQWQPEFAIRLIEAGVWGNTIATAATERTCDRARSANLPALTKLIDRALFANLPNAIAVLITRLQNEAAIASDITHLMEALPPLVDISRYGTVRQIETGMIESIVDGLIARICIGLPVACASLDDDAAAKLYSLLLGVHSAIGLLGHSDYTNLWQQTLAQLADQQTLHGLLAGRCCRLLFEVGKFTAAETARRLGLALSMAIEPLQAAHWLEGFLKGSGLLLLHNPALWQVLDDWVSALPEAAFITLLPLLRRTFATFPAPERRQMGERSRHSTQSPQSSSTEFEPTRADAVLPIVAQLLGISSG